MFFYRKITGEGGREERRKKLNLPLDFFRPMRYNIKVAVERYSNGKEPHWKCGVPQGIVRSSRILSAKRVFIPQTKGLDFIEAFCFLLSTENHSLGEWFKERLVPMM